MRKNLNLPVILSLLSLSIIMTSCEAIGDIFKAGAWFGVIGVVLVVALILWLVGKARR